MRLYNQTLLRYNDMTKTHVNKPTRVVVVNEETIVNEDDNDGENDTLSEIVATMPTSIQPKARMLTARLKKMVDWNDRGDCKSHGRRVRHKSYALRLASCYNKRCVRAYIANKSC